jgi:hypothetical protein
MAGPSPFTAPIQRARCRIAYAAAHVVAATPDQVDWERTLAYRRHLWSLGLGVAEAMDTAQRGMGLDWGEARELMQRSLAEARSTGGAIVCGAATDQLGPPLCRPLSDIVDAYQEQCALIEEGGGQAVVMASRHLAASARDSDDYARVYGNVLSSRKRPVILHWLGGMFDPALAGYWGTTDLNVATEVCLSIIQEHELRVDGIKLSLLDADREVAFRRRLPAGVRMYTGDDFHYPALIRGDGDRHSDALLGILDAIAPAAAAALQAADQGDWERYEEILAPTVPLSRHIFTAPTFHYKAGIVCLAYLNGHQPELKLLQGLERARSIVHYAELFILADRAGLLVDPELAVARMQALLSASGVEGR